MNLKIFAIISMFAINAQAITINCLQASDFNDLCSSITDRSKVKYVNCLDGKTKDSYEARLCENTHWIDESGRDSIFNCFSPGITEYSLTHKVCSGIPKKETIEKIDCTVELGDSYEQSRCANVDTVEQAFIKKLLWISSEGLRLTTGDRPIPEISCIGELENSFNLNWCEDQKSKRYKACEDAAVKGLQSYFDMKFMDAKNLQVKTVINEGDAYKVAYEVGPLATVLEKTVLVTDNSNACYAVEIQN